MFQDGVKLVPGPWLQEKHTSEVAANLEDSSSPGHLLRFIAVR